MSKDNLPIIDWDMAIKMAGNNEQAAHDLLQLFIENLDGDLETIRLHYQDKNYIQLQQAIHKLHGAVCYCGLPRLKNLLHQLETDLKSDILKNLPSQIRLLEIEVQILLEHYSQQQKQHSA